MELRKRIVLRLPGRIASVLYRAHPSRRGTGVPMQVNLTATGGPPGTAFNAEQEDTE